MFSEICPLRLAPDDSGFHLSGFSSFAVTRRSSSRPLSRMKIVDIVEDWEYLAI